MQPIISIHDKWIAPILDGAKKIEYRGWHFSRGCQGERITADHTILMHCSKGPKELKGRILGSFRVAACTKNAYGQYEWLLTDVTPLWSEQVLKGSLFYWTSPEPLVLSSQVPHEAKAALSKLASAYNPDGNATCEEPLPESHTGIVPGVLPYFATAEEEEAVKADLQALMCEISGSFRKNYASTPIESVPVDHITTVFSRWYDKQDLRSKPPEWFQRLRTHACYCSARYQGESHDHARTIEALYRQPEPTADATLDTGSDSCA